MTNEERILLVSKLEDLFGGTKMLPEGITEENEDAVLETWNSAISECIKIVEEI